MNDEKIKAVGAEKETKSSIQDKDYEDVLKKQESIRYGQDTEERKLLSHWVIWVVSVWLFLVLATVILNEPLCLKIDNSVSCMLLGTTTINILGLAYIVLKGLFGDSPKNNTGEQRFFV